MQITVINVLFKLDNNNDNISLEIYKMCLYNTANEIEIKLRTSNAHSPSLPLSKLLFINQERKKRTPMKKLKSE